MDIITRRLLEDKISFKELDSLNQIKHEFNIDYVEEDSFKDTLSLHYRCVRDLRTILISSIITARHLTRLGEFSDVIAKLMGFDGKIDYLLFKELESICYSDMIDNNIVLGYGDISLGNELCKDERTELLKLILMQGYNIDSTYIADVDCKDMCYNLTYSEVQAIPNGILFVRNVGVPVVLDEVMLRNKPTKLAVYEHTIAMLKDIELYDKVLNVVLSCIEDDSSYLLFRERVAKNLTGLGIEVVDSLVTKPKIRSSCPISISYAQLDDVFMHCILDKLLWLY